MNMTTTLAHQFYHDSAVFEYECEHVFPRHWWLVATESEFAENGDYFAFNLLQWPIVLVRDALSGFTEPENSGAYR